MTERLPHSDYERRFKNIHKDTSYIMTTKSDVRNLVFILVAIFGVYALFIGFQTFIQSGVTTNVLTSFLIGIIALVIVLYFSKSK